MRFVFFLNFSMPLVRPLRCRLAAPMQQVCFRARTTCPIALRTAHTRHVTSSYLCFRFLAFSARSIGEGGTSVSTVRFLAQNSKNRLKTATQSLVFSQCSAHSQRVSLSSFDFNSHCCTERIRCRNSYVRSVDIILAYLNLINEKKNNNNNNAHTTHPHYSATK